jgi:hypothetical protein
VNRDIQKSDKHGNLRRREMQIPSTPHLPFRTKAVSFESIQEGGFTTTINSTYSIYCSNVPVLARKASDQITIGGIQPWLAIACTSSTLFL